jgi:outer membrane protein assembly factor BamB
MVHLLARDDGAVAGRFTSDGSPIVSPPLAAGRHAVLQTSAGSLVAVALD